VKEILLLFSTRAKKLSLCFVRDFSVAFEIMGWLCQVCTFVNNSYMIECESCGMGKNGKGVFYNPQDTFKPAEAEESEEGLKKFLESIGISECLTVLQSKGVEKPSDLGKYTMKDMEEELNMTPLGVARVYRALVKRGLISSPAKPLAKPQTQPPRAQRSAQLSDDEKNKIFQMQVGMLKNLDACKDQESIKAILFGLQAMVS